MPYSCCYYSGSPGLFPVKKITMEKEIVFIVLVLFLLPGVSGDCYNENRTIETYYYGDQLVDYMGCELVELRDNMPGIVGLLSVFLLVLLGCAFVGGFIVAFIGVVWYLLRGA